MMVMADHDLTRGPAAAGRLGVVKGFSVEEGGAR
jgi:hypothetical protein